ncbi:hypothetical protein [Marinobacter subterrani]|uniref:hypothetical protein n=1 Tax=Marinobacter subterrani TaxID=1658765 RepID=UPI00235383E5|nr:hypothetical protein [Marinobacter subterrani]
MIEMEEKSRIRLSEEALKRNIYNRYRALQSAYSNPKVAPALIIDGCKTQTALARLNYPQYQITPIARMSLFKYADLVLRGADYKIPEGEKGGGETGWAYLDWLRKQVFTAGVKSSSFRTKAARAERAKQRRKASSDKLLQAERHALAVSKAYVQLFREVRIFSNSDHLNDVSRQRLYNILNNADGLHSELFSSNDLRDDNVEELSNREKV